MKHGRYLPNFVAAVDAVISAAKPGDVIMTLGAGDVSSLAPIIVQGLTQ
jgi:UDP-N-acetylmuramate--alanine ligase